MKETEVEIRLIVRGVVTPEQWEQLRHTPADQLYADIAELFRDRLTAREVTVERIDFTDPQDPF